MARSELAHASYPGFSFARPGSALIGGKKKGEFRGVHMNTHIRAFLLMTRGGSAEREPGNEVDLCVGMACPWKRSIIIIITKKCFDRERQNKYCKLFTGLTPDWFILIVKKIVTF